MTPRVEIVSVEGRRLVLHQPTRGSDEDIWSFTAELSIETGQASVAVWELGPGLADFFDRLADQWTGFDGVEEYGSLEGNLTIACTHDGRGAVNCRVAIGQSWPPNWTLTAEMSLGAGAHLEGIASEVRTLVNKSLGA